MIFALGGGLALYNMQFYAEQTTQQWAPEFVAYAYFPLKSDILLRTGLRMNYAWDQTHNTQALNVSQTDFRYMGEVGVVYNWIVMPSLSTGFGADYRVIKLTTQAPIFVPKDNISSSKNLSTFYLQAGLGFPLIKGLLVIEPYARYTLTWNDPNQVFGYGIEATFQLN